MTNTFGHKGSRDPMKCRLSVLVPTLNEEVNLPDCLASVVGWAKEIWVVDSYSTDRTPEIARQSEANMMQHPFDGYAAQKNWALENVPFSCEWLLILDADERVSLELADEIRGIIAADGNGYDGFYLNRKLIFYGKWIRHCGWYPSWNLRLFRHVRGRYEQREVHEHLVLEGKVGYCKHDLIHEDLRDMSFCIAKHNRYSSQEARELDMVRRGVGTTGLQASLLQRERGAQALYQGANLAASARPCLFVVLLSLLFPSWFFGRQTRLSLLPNACHIRAVHHGEALGTRAPQAGRAGRHHQCCQGVPERGESGRRAFEKVKGESCVASWEPLVPQTRFVKNACCED